MHCVPCQLTATGTDPGDAVLVFKRSLKEVEESYKPLIALTEQVRVCATKSFMCRSMCNPVILLGSMCISVIV
jgi:hypothetical protein